MSDQPKVGFIGLGQIGGPLAGHLVDWPGGLVVCDLREEATAELAEKGAEVAASPAEVGAQAQVIQVMVLDDAQVREVVGQILATASAGTVIAIHSTIRAETAEELEVEAAAKGIAVVDAPVSGGFMGAYEGNLAVLVGGSDEAVERLREPFACWSEMFVHTGPVGSGTRMKLARNLITFASYAAGLEAARLAEAAGVSVKDLGDVVRHSDRITGGPGAIMVRDTAVHLAPDDGLYEIFCHTRTLGEKDMEMAIAMADELGVDLPVTQLALLKFADYLGVPHETSGGGAG